MSDFTTSLAFCGATRRANENHRRASAGDTKFIRGGSLLEFFSIPLRSRAMRSLNFEKTREFESFSIQYHREIQ